MAVSYQLVIDCASPEPLARFWADAVKNRLHIDASRERWSRRAGWRQQRERVEAEAARLVALGATRKQAIVEEGLDHYAVALTDPEGNEFDIN